MRLLGIGEGGVSKTDLIFLQFSIAFRLFAVKLFKGGDNFEGLMVSLVEL